MKTAIIGAGNMGGSIARGLAKGTIIPASDIIVSNPTQGKLDALKAEFPALQTTRDNQEAVTGAELIILAVKPWLIKPVVSELKLKSKQILISVAAGIPFEELAHYVADKELHTDSKGAAYIFGHGLHGIHGNTNYTENTDFLYSSSVKSV